MSTATKTAHGRYVHGTPYRLRDGGYIRIDAYTPDREGHTSHDRVHVLGAADDSPVYCGTYSAACSCCYLNFTHSEALHADRIGPAAAPRNDQIAPISIEQAIRNRVAELRAMPEIPEHLRRAVANAEEWLAAGALSRYSNHDFDVWNGLQ